MCIFSLETHTQKQLFTVDIVLVRRVAAVLTIADICRFQTVNFCSQLFAYVTLRQAHFQLRERIARHLDCADCLVAINIHVTSKCLKKTDSADINRSTVKGLLIIEQERK